MPEQEPSSTILPDVRALNALFDSDANSLGAAYCSRIDRQSSVWTLFAIPEPTGVALVIGDNSPLAPHFLGRQFAAVQVWNLDQDRSALQERVVSYQSENVTTEFVPAASILGRLQELSRHYSLIAIDDPDGSFLLELPALKTVAAALKPDAACIVIGENGKSLPRLRADFRKALRQISARELRQRAKAVGLHKSQTWFPHPNHLSPSEVIGWPHELAAIRRRSIKILHRLGARESVQASMICLATNHSKSTTLAEIIDAAAELVGRSEAVVKRFHSRPSGTVVVLIESAGVGNVVRIPMRRSALTRLLRANDSIESVTRNLPWIAPLVPRILGSGERLGFPFFVESLCCGIPAAERTVEIQTREKVQNIVRRFLVRFAGEGKVKLLTSDEFDALVNRYLSRIVYKYPQNEEPITRITEWLRARLVGQPFRLVQIHGDFNPKNVLLNAETCELQGIIDWDVTEEFGLPGQDLLHFTVRSDPARYRLGVGPNLLSALRGESLTQCETQLLKTYFEELDLSPDLVATLPLLHWAHHVSGQLDPSRDQYISDRWVEHNVHAPLNQIGHLLPS